MRGVKQFLCVRVNIEAIMAQPPSENPPLSIPLTEDDPRFSSDEMLVCRSCGRSVPPNRTTCLYCGMQVSSDAIKTDIAKINLRRPETWEDGFSLVYSGSRELNAETISTAAGLMQIERERLERILAVAAPVPLAYLKSLPDAELLALRLSQFGFDCAIVGDDLLQARTLPTRVRSVVFEDDAVLLQDFNNGKFSSVNQDEQVLIVTGALVKTSTEIEGKVKKGTVTAATETMSSTDETVIDIYPKNDVYGFRIRTSGFDFSCLGDQKQPLAAVNMAALIDRLSEQFADAVFIDSFQTATPFLNSVWPVDETRRSGSVSRSAFGGVRKESTTVIDNTIQFTKFSRLQRHFI